MLEQLTGISGTELLNGFMHVGMAIFMVVLGGKFFINARKAHRELDPENPNLAEFQIWIGLSLMAFALLLFSAKDTIVETRIHQFLGAPFPLIEGLSVLLFGVFGAPSYLNGMYGRRVTRERPVKESKPVTKRVRGKRSAHSDNPTTITQMSKMLGS